MRTTLSVEAGVDIICATSLSRNGFYSKLGGTNQFIGSISYFASQTTAHDDVLVLNIF